MLQSSIRNEAIYLIADPLEADGMISAFNDSRTFSDLLIDWQIATGIADPRAFIKHIGLENHLSEEDFLRLTEDQAAPNFWLGEFFIAKIPSHVATTIKVRNRLDDAAIDHRYSTVSISEEVFRREHFESVSPHNSNAPKHNPYPVLSKGTPTSTDLLDLVLDVAEELASQQGLTLPDNNVIIENLSKKCGLHPWVLQGYIPIPFPFTVEEVAHNITEVLIGSTSENYEPFFERICKYLNSIKEINLAEALKDGADVSFGEVITLLRRNLGISRKELGELVAREMGREKPYDPEYIRKWENEFYFPSDKNVLVALVSAFGLEEDSAKRFMQKRWENPDITWQHKLQKAQTFGQMVQAYRHLAHMEQSEVAEALGLNLNSVSLWERNATSPDVTLFNKLIKLYQIDESGNQRLQAKYWEKHDKEWNFKLREAADFGQLLKVYRNLAHYSQKSFAEALGVNSTAVEDWETGKKKPHKKNLVLITETLKLNTDAEQKLLDAYWCDHDKEWEEKLKAGCTLGDVILAHRNLAHLSQAELAEEAQISQSLLSKIESNRFSPSRELLVKISAALKFGHNINEEILRLTDIHSNTQPFN